MSKNRKNITLEMRERYRQIGINLKRLRIEEMEEKPTQQELAKYMRIATLEKISYARISKLESGMDEPTQTELRAYKKYFPKATTDFILGYTDCLTNNYKAISVSQAFGLSDESLFCLKCIKEHGVTNGVINELFHGKNGELFESMLYYTNKLLDIIHSDTFITISEGKLEEGKRRYQKRTGKILKNYLDEDFILNDLNEVSNEERHLREQIILTRLNIENIFRKIITNTIKKSY